MTETLQVVNPESHPAGALDRLRRRVDAFIAALPDASDADLVESARRAGEMEAQGFRLRGAVAAEMMSRIRERVRLDPSRYGKGDAAIVEQMRALALEIGVAFSTLYEDCRIYQTFGDEILLGEESGRLVYRTALKAADPHAAVRLYAERRAADPGYSAREFARDVGGARPPAGDSPADSDTREVTWELTRPVLRAVHEMSETLACDHELVVSYAVMYAARALEEGRDIRSRI